MHILKLNNRWYPVNCLGSSHKITKMKVWLNHVLTCLILYKKYSQYTSHESSRNFFLTFGDIDWTKGKYTNTAATWQWYVNVAYMFYLQSTSLPIAVNFQDYIAYFDGYIMTIKRLWIDFATAHHFSHLQNLFSN